MVSVLVLACVMLGAVGCNDATSRTAQYAAAYNSLSAEQRAEVDAFARRLSTLDRGDIISVTEDGVRLVSYMVEENRRPHASLFVSNAHADPARRVIGYGPSHLVMYWKVHVTGIKKKGEPGWEVVAGHHFSDGD